MFSAHLASARSYAWKASGTADWFTASSWNPSGPPASADNATFSNSGTAIVNNNAKTAVATDVTLNSGVLIVKSSGSSTDLYVQTGSPHLIITGTGASWTNTELFYITAAGATVTVSAGATLNTVTDTAGGSNAYIDGGGSLLVTDAGSTWNNPGLLSLYTGSITLQNYATATTGEVDLASTPYSDNHSLVTVTGSAHWDMQGLAIGASGTGALLVSAGGSGSSTDTYIANGSFTVTGPGSSWTASEGFTLNPLSGATGSVVVSNGAILSTNTISGATADIDGGGSFLVTGSGSQWNNPSAVYIYTGSLMVQDHAVITAGDTQISFNGGQGLLSVSGGGQLNADSIEIGGAGSGALQIADGGAVDVGNGTGSVSIATSGTLLLGTGGLAGTISADSISNDGLIAANFTDTTTIAAGISGEGRLNKDGSGTLILTGANNFSGGTTIAAGKLQIGNGGTSGSLAGNVSNSGTLVFDRSNSLTYRGIISGTGAVQQIGTGTTKLTGANTFTGATLVSGGMLLIIGDDSAATGETTVQMSGALGGTGTIGGQVTVQAGGILAPGATLGQLTLKSGLTIEAGATLIMEFSGRDAGQYDQLDVQGIFAAGGTLDLVINASFTPVLGDSFTIFDGATPGFDSGSFTILTNLGSGLAWDTSALASSGIVSVTAIPEPSTWALLIVAGLGACIHCRRTGRPA